MTRRAALVFVVLYAMIAGASYSCGIWATSQGDALSIAYGVIFDLYAVACCIHAAGVWKLRKR